MKCRGSKGCGAEAIPGRVKCQRHLDMAKLQASNFRDRNPGYDKAHLTKWALENRLRKNFNDLKSKAKQRGLEFTLDFAMYEVVMTESRCMYCFGPLPQHGGGLDRLDNRLGYTWENVKLCCGDCNLKKGHLEGAGFTYPRTVELMEELRVCKRAGSPHRHRP